MKPTASGVNSVTGGSAWAKPLALQSTSPSASPASSASSTGTAGAGASASTVTPKTAESIVETPSTANLHGNDSLNGLNGVDGASGIQLDGSWSSAAFNANPSAASYLSNAAWTFPSVAGNTAGILPSTDATGNDFSTFNQSAFFQNLAVDAAKQQQMAGLNFSGLAGAGATDFNKALMGSQSNETWNDFSALNQQQQQQQQQWAALSDAAKSGNAQFPMVATEKQGGALPNTSPSESMEIVQSHFANLSAQHGGQLPINQAALDSLIQSAGAMPAGPEQQQLLTMIDMLLQLHNAGQNQQQQSNQQSQLNSNQAFGTAANFAWNTPASNANSLLPSALTFPSLPTFTSSTGSAASLPALTQASNAFSVDLLQQAQQQQPQSGNSLLNSLRTDNGLDEAALAGVALPANTAANEWMSLAQFQASSSSALSGASSGASATTASTSLLADFGSSPIRPARTTTNAGYNDVPESASPFSYDQYTNLSVTARPFQPTPQPVAAATTTPAITAGADGLDSIASSFAALGGANTLLLQQQLSQQLNQQNELNASLAALGVAGSDRQLFDLSSGLYDPNDPMSALQMGNNSSNQSNNLGHGNSHHSHRDRNNDRDFGRGGDRYNNRDNNNNFGGGFNDRDRHDRGDRQQGSNDRYARYDKRGSSKVNDYNRSGMDRFDYIQHQVNQANKAKSRLFEEGRAGFLPPTRSGNRDGGFNEFPMNTPTQPVPSAAAQALTPQQQQLLSQILAKSFGAADASANADANGNNGSLPNASDAISPSTQLSHVPVTMDAASALSTLTASPEFQSLTSQQQAQIYSSVQQMQAQQQAAAHVTAVRTDSASGATGTANSSNNSGAAPGVGVSPVLGALASPLSSSVVHITANSKVEDVLAQIVKPDLAKLSELLRQQQVAITNAALGNSSTPASVSLPPNADDGKPVDKSKLRPPKPRARRTEFPDEAPSTLSSTAAPTNEPVAAAGVSAASVDPAALNQLQSVLQNASLSHSARVAVIRNVSASASATAFANAFVEALVKTVPNEEKAKKPEPAAAAVTVAASTVTSPLVTAAVAPAAFTPATSTAIPVMRVRKRHNISNTTDSTAADNANGSPSTNPSSTPVGDSASDVDAGKESAGEFPSSSRGSARRGRGGRENRGPRPPRAEGDKRGPRNPHRAKTEEGGASDNSAAPQAASSSGDNATESPPAAVSSGPHSSRFNPRGSNRGRGPRPAFSNAPNTTATDSASAASVSSPSDVTSSSPSTFNRDSPQKRAGRGRGGYKGKRGGGATADSAPAPSSAE